MFQVSPHEKESETVSLLKLQEYQNLEKIDQNGIPLKIKGKQQNFKTSQYYEGHVTNYPLLTFITNS